MIYTIDNPKLVTSSLNFEGMDTFTGVVKDKYGAIVYFLNGKRHRENGPAIEWGVGFKQWWLNGKLHREDGHAREFADGTKEWYLNGKLHREDGPAREFADGDTAWYLNDEFYGFNNEYTKESWIKLVRLELLR